MSKAKAGWVLLLMLALSGCASWFKSDITKLDLRLTAAADLNPDLSGRPSPLVVRLYELKSPAIFQNADFFSLYEYDRESLGMDLVKTEEILMTPGQHTEVRAALSEQTNYLAVMAAYRDIERSNWRYVMPVSFREKNAKTLIFQAQGIVEKD